MYRGHSTFLGEIVNSCYERGLLALKSGEIKKAKKLFYSAAENTLALAKETSGDARAKLIERADELCSFADAIDSKTEKDTQKREEDKHSVSYSAGDEEEKDFSIASSCTLTFDDVLGLDDVKDEIRRLAVYPMEYPELYEQFKKKKGGGILLYGVPGTGKTMIARAIAGELGAAFYPIKCSDILSKWFGEAEQNIKALFDQAAKNPVSVIFFDEFEALGSKRDTDSTSMKRIIPELLVGIQQAEEKDNTMVIIAATNRPWDIDSAFLRPGRFSLSIHVPLPDAAARRGMIESIMLDVPRAKELDVERIVELSEGFSGADIASVCEQLKDSAIERIINGSEDEFITNADVERVFDHICSSVQAEDLRNIEEYRKKVTNSR